MYRIVTDSYKLITYIKDHIIYFLKSERFYFSCIHFSIQIHALCFLGKNYRYIKVLCSNTGDTDTGCFNCKDFSDWTVGEAAFEFFAKKAQSVNLDGEMYTTKVESFTHKKVYDVILSRKFLGPEDHVLLIDDFLANGCALLGLIDIVKKSGATLEGAGIVIEKGFQHGGQEIRDMGIRLESLAIVDSMTDDSLTFRD